MAVAEINDGKIWVDCDFNQKDRVLTLPGARWDRVNSVCTLNLSYASCKQLRSILGEDLEIGDRLYEWAVEEVQSRVEPCLQLRQATQVKDIPSLLCDTMGVSIIINRLREMGYA